MDRGEEVKPGQTIEDNGEKWICLRVAGGRAEIKRLGTDEAVKPKPNRKERRKMWAEIRRKAKRGKVVG